MGSLICRRPGLRPPVAPAEPGKLVGSLAGARDKTNWTRTAHDSGNSIGFGDQSLIIGRVEVDAANQVVGAGEVRGRAGNLLKNADTQTGGVAGASWSQLEPVGGSWSQLEAVALAGRLAGWLEPGGR